MGNLTSGRVKSPLPTNSSGTEIIRQHTDMCISMSDDCLYDPSDDHHTLSSRQWVQTDVIYIARHACLFLVPMSRLLC